MMLATLAVCTSCRRAAVPSMPSIPDVASSAGGAAAGGAPSRAAPELDLIQHALKAIDDSLMPAQAAALMGGTLQASDRPLSWRVALDSSSTTVLLDVGADSHVGTIRLGFDAGTPLRLRDLSTLFGRYRVVAEGEESSVRFQSATGAPVFVWLFARRVVPDAPIIRVFFYRDAERSAQPAAR